MKITAHVPVQQYGFIEIEGDPTDLLEIERLYNQYAEKPVDFGGAPALITTQVLTSPFNDAVVLYDEANHVYFKDGYDMLSGSAFAERYTPKFNKDVILPLFAKKHGVDPLEISEMWDMKGEVGKAFGTALHKGLEFYGKHKKTIDATQGTFEIHPSIKGAVLEFFEGRELEKTPAQTTRLAETALYEPFIHFEGYCGFIDRLVIVDRAKKIAIIEDFKTDADLHKGKGKMLAPFESMKNEPLSRHQLQLSFYAHIMGMLGWVIPKLRIHHYTDTWNTIELDVLDLTEVL